jgi:hypothetical protein
LLDCAFDEVLETVWSEIELSRACRITVGWILSEGSAGPFNQRREALLTLCDDGVDSNSKWLAPYTFIQAAPVAVLYGNVILMEYAIFWYIPRATSEAFAVYTCRLVGVPLRYF